MPGDQLQHSLQFLILVFARVTIFPVSEKVPAFLKYSDFENIYPKWEVPVTFCRLKGAKDPPSTLLLPPAPLQPHAAAAAQ